GGRGGKAAPVQRYGCLAAAQDALLDGLIAIRGLGVDPCPRPPDALSRDCTANPSQRTTGRRRLPPPKRRDLLARAVDSPYRGWERENPRGHPPPARSPREPP